ncbi:hypothetical protein G8A07_10965 [Roseateles sp. DAIF2]|uniref:ADP-ribosyltransferase n=1 Tax=Roseateles sp. DAIF2 TaxID=2714952 RepID=UPI0018A311BA|nr:ADP-ribosyltransferase [Roseateles sp. DAIF2]QPF73385.1 hypothetical protein G8A07_10965 [Roseateles sp. DAIF2]
MAQFQTSDEATQGNADAQWFDALREAVRACADQELAVRRQSSDDCPYIAAWFAKHEGDGRGRLRQAALRYAPEAASARNDEELIARVVERVRAGLRVNIATGSERGIPGELLFARAPTPPPRAPVLQRCGDDTDEAPARRDPFAQAEAAKRRYLQDPDLSKLLVWRRELRAARERAGGFRALPQTRQRQVTADFEQMARDEIPLRREERRRRARQVRSDLDILDTSDTLHGVPDSKVIEDYTSPSTGKAERYFNKPLRDLDATEEQAGAIISLQNALLMSPVHKGDELWRGTGHLIGGASLDTLAVGKTYREPGFLSTSIKRSIAEGFGKGSDTHFMIRIRSYRSGRDIISLGGDEYGGGEEEVLFPAGCTFRYLGYSKEDRCHDYDEG